MSFETLKRSLIVTKLSNSSNVITSTFLVSCPGISGWSSTSRKLQNIYWPVSKEGDKGLEG